MKEHHSRTIGRLAAPLTLLLAFALLQAVARPGPAVSLWAGYRAVLVGADAGQAEAALRSAGAGEVLSAASEDFCFSEFDSLGRATLASLDERLDPRDPRRDAYVEGLKNIFRFAEGGEEWSFLLVGSGFPQAAISAALGQAFPGAAVFIAPEGSGGGGESIALGSSFLFYASFLIAVLPRPARKRLLSTLPIALAMRPWTSVEGLMVSLLLLVAALGAGEVLFRRAEPLRELGFRRWARSEKRAIARAATAFIPLAVASAVFPGQALAVALAAVALCAGYVSLAMHPLRIRRREHRLFVPVSLGARAMAPRGAMEVPIAIAMAVTLAACAFLRAFPAESLIAGGAPFPHPVPSSSGAGLSLDAYVAHVEFQRSFPFRRLGDGSGAEPGVERFADKGGARVDSWKENPVERYSPAPPMPRFEAILAAQPAGSAVARGGELKAMTESVPWAGAALAGFLSLVAAAAVSRAAGGKDRRR